MWQVIYSILDRSIADILDIRTHANQHAIIPTGFHLEKGEGQRHSYYLSIFRVSPASTNVVVVFRRSPNGLIVAEP
jgi:hypothetical protein